MRVHERKPDGAGHPTTSTAQAQMGTSTPIRVVAWLQANAGNRATSGLITHVQRQHIALPGGGQVSAVSGPGVNVRENVLAVLDRLVALWSMTTEDYGQERRSVLALPPGETVDAAQLRRTIAAIRRNEEPSIAPAVAQRFLNLALSAPVGPGQPNVVADVTALQRFFRGRGMLSPSAEQLSGDSADLSRLPGTRAALTRTKALIAAGDLGWMPVQAAEGDLGGDRFGGQTFQHTRPVREIDRRNALFGQYSIFVPRGAGAATNHVRIHFSAGGVIGSSGTNAVLQHGLRASSDSSDWITIAVPGIDNRTGNTITTSEIQACLERVGRPTRIDALMLTAHSRGVLSLAATLRSRSIPGSLVQRVVLYDETAGAAAAIQHAGIPASRVIMYAVNSRSDGPGRTVDLRGLAAPLRAIGFLRILEGARSTRPDVTVPGYIQSQLIPLPPLGAFSTRNPVTAGKVSIAAFCRTNQSALQSIIAQAQQPRGLQYFIEEHDLARFGARTDDDGNPLPPGRMISPGIYSHHLFVTEFAHEATD